MSDKKYTYFFGLDSKQHNLTEGDASMRNLLGGKGANLAEMSKLNLPVPPGFTLSTEVCTHYYQNHKSYPKALNAQVEACLTQLQNIRAKKLGDAKDPLLLSVRSGARVSMPGMMDTILNLGLNDETVAGLATVTNNPRFAYDSYRRFIQMYSSVVMDIHSSVFESKIDQLKESKGIQEDADLSADDFKALANTFKKIVIHEKGHKFPQDVNKQLWGAIDAVFDSWNSSRAKHYRKMENIDDSWGTAVNVQSMVFGNMGDDCATGVAFTRDPSTGEKYFFGEYLTNAQGEDVVAGIRTPCPLNRAGNTDSSQKSLEEVMPETYKDLDRIQQTLEKHYKDMQDIEFTIEKSTLFLLQTRTGKRTAQSAIKIAVDMVSEGMIDKQQALLRINPYSLDQLLHPRLDPNAKGSPVAIGLPASPGAVSGQVVMSSTKASAMFGEDIILVRHETSPEDVQGMDASKGILTALGGMTSHAAVVARGMGKCCVAGCADLKIDYNNSCFSVNKNGETLVIKEGDTITLDGNTGEIFLGKIATIQSTQDENFRTIMDWADEVRQLGVRTNADTPTDAKVAVGFGAEGIGLCRTEHMFFEPDRIEAVRQMILAESPLERAAALEKILPMQRGDFIDLFKTMQDRPVTIRLLDPPLHEFLPHKESDIESLAEKLGSSSARLMMKTRNLEEMNPMLGHRGCRLAISFPEIYLMQTRAICEAIIEASQQGVNNIHAEIMVPLVADAAELRILREKITQLKDSIFSASGQQIHVHIGTMLELPRACLLADQIAEHADFLSFGTNDLTQTTYGLSRDDSGKFLPEYIDHKIFAVDPFVSVDQQGVGALVKMAVEKAKASRPQIKTGVCGEHGGDPTSIHFFHTLGLDYVSCSPYRVPAARLAAAHATLKAQDVCRRKDISRSEA